jgi:hypothetical protein
VLPVLVAVVVVVVLVEVPGSVVPASGEDSVFASVEEAGVSVPALGVAPEPAFSAVPDDWELSLDDGDVAESSAQATPFPVAMAVPIPNATARRPTRPT